MQVNPNYTTDILQTFR